MSDRDLEKVADVRNGKSRRLLYKKFLLPYPKTTAKTWFWLATLSSRPRQDPLFTARLEPLYSMIFRVVLIC